MIYAFDIEIFKNCFTATFVDIDNEFDCRQFVIFGNRDDRQELKHFINSQKDLTLVGFNNLSFDNVFINALLADEFEVQTFYNIGQKLVSQERDIEETKKYHHMAVPYQSIDLMRVMLFDTLGISLKQTAILLDWNLIQDLPIEHDAWIEEKDIKTILDYNLNDTLITRKFYLTILPRIELRRDIGKLFGVDVMSSSDSHMANVLLNQIYTKKSGMKLDKLRNLRTNRDEVKASDCISKAIQFKTKEFNDLLAGIKKLVLAQANGYRFSKEFTYKTIAFDIGVGGLHSRDEAGIFISDSKYTITDCDVASFYPNIILNNNICPAHLKKETFISILRQITKERLEAKKNKEKAKADGLKITINSIFGKLGSEHFWLYDPLAFFSVTINGQLYLLMLIERLFEAGIEVISANTDGVVSKVANNKKEVFKAVCKQWEQDTNFELEFAEYKKYIRRDVNNYVTVKPDGSVKTKGIFETEINLNRPNPGTGYKHQIISKALHGYFLHNQDVSEFIRNPDNSIYDYLISQKSARKFKSFLRCPEGDKQLQKNNRFFVSNDGGYLIKKDGEKEIGIIADSKVTILNNIIKTEAKFYNVNYEWYESEAMKIVNKIEPSTQVMSLF
jgi:hypothetical protein